MSTLRHRLLRLEHSAGPNYRAEQEPPPMNDEELAEFFEHWLSQDRASLSFEDQKRYDCIQFILERARRRAELAQEAT